MRKCLKQAVSVALALALTMTAVPVDVQAAAKPKLNVTKKTIMVGSKVKLKVKNAPKAVSVTWKSSNKAAATVNKKGVVTGKAGGDSIITCKVKANAKTYKLKAAIKVKDSVVVSTQKALNTALENKKLTKIKIKTDKAKNFTIKKGSYKNTLLIVEAPNADVENNGGVFKRIAIWSIKPATWIERAKGNIFTVSASNSRIVVGKNGSVNSITFTSDGSKGTVDVRGNVDTINLNGSIDLNLTGTNTDSSVDVNASAEGSSVSSDIPVNVNANENVEVELNKGAEGSTVTTTDSNVNVEIKNDTETNVTVTTPDGSGNVSAGSESTSNTVVPPSTNNDANNTGNTGNTGSNSNGGGPSSSKPSTSTKSDEADIKTFGLENVKVAVSGGSIVLSGSAIKGISGGGANPDQNITVTVEAETNELTADEAKKVDITSVEAAVKLTVSEKASVTPKNGETVDFIKPVTFTVTAENGKTKNYTVTVKREIIGTKVDEPSNNPVNPTPETYTVTFNSAGGSTTPDTQTVAENATAKEPSDPTRTGYRFLGWYLSDGTKYEFTEKVTADITLTAKWQGISAVEFKKMTEAAYAEITYAGKPTEVTSFYGDDFTVATGTVADNKATVTISGTLNYIEKFTGFDKDLTSGYYLPIYFEVPDYVTDASKTTITIGNGEEQALPFTAQDKTFCTLIYHVPETTEFDIVLDWDGDGSDWDAVTYTVAYDTFKLSNASKTEIKLITDQSSYEKNITYKGKPEQVASFYEDGFTITTGEVVDNEVTVTVSGTLNYIENFTGFDSKLTSGYYFPIYFEVPENVDASNATVKIGNGKEKTLKFTDQDNQLYALIYHDPTNTQDFKIEVDWDGSGSKWDPVTYNFVYDDLKTSKASKAAFKVMNEVDGVDVWSIACKNNQGSDWTGKPKSIDQVITGGKATTTKTDDNAYTVTFEGALQKVDNFTGFDNAAGKYVSGYYLPIYFMVPEYVADASKAVVTVGDKDYTAPFDELAVGSDKKNVLTYVVHVAVADASSVTGEITIKIDWDGSGSAWDTTTYTLQLDGLTIGSN